MSKKAKMMRNHVTRQEGKMFVKSGRKKKKTSDGYH